MGVAVWVIFCFVVAGFAHTKGRSAVGWFFLSIFISPLLAGIGLAMSKDLTNDTRVDNVERHTNNLEQEVKFNQKYNDLRSSYMQKEIDSNRNLTESALIPHTNRPSLMNQSNASSVIKCPNCGTKLDQNYLFCPHCGQKLIKNCTNCGEEVPFNASFCPNCGEKLTNIREYSLSYNTIDSFDKNAQKIPSEEFVDINSFCENTFLELVLVEKGQFFMGDVNEGNKHELTYDFAINKSLTTFDDFDRYCKSSGNKQPDDQDWGIGSRPLINVSWFDAIAYCNWLSRNEFLSNAYDSYGNLLDEEGRITTDPSKVVGYRLPTEAEWEYAAKGGKKSKEYRFSGSNNAHEVAWYFSNSSDKTREVCLKAPNELGIYDMSGNVWEWCSDWYHSYSHLAKTNPYNSTSSSFRVIRGGSWYNVEMDLSVSNRSKASPTKTSNYLGFRICSTIVE